MPGRAPRQRTRGGYCPCVDVAGTLTIFLFAMTCLSCQHRFAPTQIEKDRLAVKLELESSVESSEPDENTRVQCKLSVPVMDKRLKLRVEEKFGYRGAKALHFT